MGLSLSVQIMRGGQPAGTLQFDMEATRTIKIGRLTSAQIKLEDPKVARIHAVIEVSGADASIVDMGSTGGTLVNGSKTAKVKLKHGDQITVGETVLVVGFGSPPMASVPAPISIPKVQSFAAAPAFAAVTPGVPLVAEVARAPTFDPGGLSGAESGEPTRRTTDERLRSAAVQSAAHPSIVAEAPLTAANRVLELRFYWGELLLAMHHYMHPKKVTIGETSNTDVFISSEGLPQEEFPLVRFKDNDYFLTFIAAMEGEVEMGGVSRTLLEARDTLAKKDPDLPGAYQIKMSEDCRAVLQWGGGTFAVRFVAPPLISKAPFGKDIDLSFINSAIVSLFLHLAMVVTLSVYPHDTDALKVDLFGEPDRFASLILEAPKENTSTKDMLEKIKKQVEEKKEQIKQPEASKDKPKPLNKDLVPKNIPKVEKTAEQKKEEVAKKFSKLLGGEGAGNLLGGGGGGSLSGTLQNVIGTAGTGSSAGGLAGIGIRGSGPITGGGIGVSHGIGGIGTTGRLGGGGLSYGAGVGGLGNGRSSKIIELDTPTVEGALPADVIKKVINDNRGQVRYCYEVQLQRNQTLAGRVVVHFVIGATGGVVEAGIKETSLKSPEVEMCLVAKVKGWKFPPPAGGGTVEVNYPFIFKAS